MNGYYEIKQAKDGQFYFNLKAGNHEVILSSELYGTMAACDNGIASVQKNCQNDEMYERREAKNGKDYFVLKARNHQEIGRSEMYESKAAMENGIASVVRNGVTEVIKNKIDPLATSPDYDTGDCKYQSTLQRLVKLNEWRNCMTISEVATVLDALCNVQVLLDEMETLAQALEDTDHEPQQSFYDAILKARG